MELWNKIKPFFVRLFKSKLFYLFVGFILVCLVFTKLAFDANGAKGFPIFATVQIVVECVMFFFLYKMRKKNSPIERQFLLVATVLGLLFVFILPPGQSPDEITHFRRAYGISEGKLITDEIINDVGGIGSYIPFNVTILEKKPTSGTYDMVIDSLNEEDGEIVGQSYTSAALYNFICYIPQALACLLGRTLGMSIMGIALLMSLFNFAVWLFLTYFAIKLIPKFKAIVVFISLLPITLQEATSISPDALTIGLGLFIVSYILYLSYGKVKKLCRWDYLILSISALVIGFCKIVYLPLMLLMVIIPKEKFISVKRKWVFLGLLFVVVAILNAMWLYISSRYLVEYREGVNSGAQLMGIIGNPLGFLIVILRTVNVCCMDWIGGMLGLTFSSFVYYLPGIVFLASIVFSVLLFAQRNEEIQFKKYDRLVFIIVFLIIMLLIFTSLYLQWTPAGKSSIDGIQGRYFLPILALVPIIICRKSVKKNKKEQPREIISTNAVLYYSMLTGVMSLAVIFAQNI